MATGRLELPIAILLSELQCSSKRSEPKRYSFFENMRYVLFLGFLAVCSADEIDGLDGEVKDDQNDWFVTRFVKLVL